MRVPTAARVPPPDSREPSLYELIEFEVFDMVARGLPDGLGSGFVPLAVIAVLLQLLVSSPHFVRWVMVVATVLGFELLLASSTGAIRSRSTASRWRQCLYVLVDASGFSWGVAGWLSVPAPRPAKGVVLALRLSLTVAVLANVGASLPLYAVFIAWALLPTAIYRAVLGGAMKLGLSIGALMMIVVLTVFASRLAAATHRSLRIGHANRRLARAPEQRTREAEQANLDKSRFIVVASQRPAQPVRALGLLLNVLQGQSLSQQAQGLPRAWRMWSTRCPLGCWTFQGWTAARLSRGAWFSRCGRCCRHRPTSSRWRYSPRACRCAVAPAMSGSAATRCCSNASCPICSPMRCAIPFAVASWSPADGAARRCASKSGAAA